MGDAPGGRAGNRARQAMDIHDPAAANHVHVVARAEPHEDARHAVEQTIGALAGVLQGLPDDLEEKTLLRIQHVRLAW